MTEPAFNPSKATKAQLIERIGQQESFIKIMESDIENRVEAKFDTAVCKDIEAKVAEEVDRQINLHKAMLNATFNDAVQEQVHQRLFEADLVNPD